MQFYNKNKTIIIVIEITRYEGREDNKKSNNTYSARAAGFHEEGTWFFTFLERDMWVLSNSTLYKVMNQPS